MQQNISLSPWLADYDNQRLEARIKWRDDPSELPDFKKVWTLIMPVPGQTLVWIMGILSTCMHRLYSPSITIMVCVH